MRRTLLRLFAALIALALVAAACGDDDGGDDGTAPDLDLGGVEPSDDAETTDGEGDGGAEDDGQAEIDADITVTGSAVSPIAAHVEITSNVAVTAQLTAATDDHEVASPTTATSATEHDLPLVGMRQNGVYVVTVTLTAADGTTATETTSFTTGEIDDVIPEVEITNLDPDRRSPGVTILETNTVRAAAATVPDAPTPPGFEPLPAGNAVIGLDDDDEIVWYFNTDRFNGSVQRTPAGEVAIQNDPFGMTILEVTGEELRRYYPDNEGTAETELRDGVEFVPYHAPWVDLYTIHHDLQVLEDGTILGLSRALHEVPAERRAELCPDDDAEWGALSDVIIQMEPDGTVIRSWDLWDISSFDDLPGEFLCQSFGLGVSETERDWTHANALWFDESRDAILVSSRHTDQIIALAVSDETGPLTEVRWILGAQGTIPYDGESFHHTHGISTAANDDLVFYDNGNFRPGTESAGGTDPNYSRAVRIAVDDSSDDPAEWTATQVWDHRMIDPVTDAPLYAPIVSDADELTNGNILVTHGGAVVDPTIVFNTHVHLVEVDPTTDDVIWELTAGGEQAESSYRADRWESLYFGPLWAEG